MIQNDKIQLALDFLKKSDSNHVSIDDLIPMCNSKAQAKQNLGDVDLNGDGLISFDEVKKPIEKVTY